MGRSAIRYQLFAISLLSLFCEMLVIRWLSTEIRIFAYFKNLPLMAAFLGLGLGFLWANKRADLMKWSSIGMLYFSGLMILAIRLNLTHLSFVDQSSIMLFGDFLSGAPLLSQSLFSLAVVVVVFALSAFIFIGLGQRCGQLFQSLNPLEAYSINICGALVGITVFAALSSLQTDPGIWLVATGLLFVLVERRPASLALIALGISYSMWLAPFLARPLYGAHHVATVWSPYYRIDVCKAVFPVKDRSVQLGYNIFINYDSFQSILDGTASTLAILPRDLQKTLLEQYSKPFLILDKPLDNVLILGAGTGSDVAAALRSGAKHVDAVEIDRSIYTIGKNLHPEHPYQSSRVTAHIEDARTFLKNSREKYDVIVFATLDSHTAFSSLSSLRTDNYVFTVQSYRDALRLLKPGGMVTVNFVAVPDWLWDRHCKDLYLASGKLPSGSFWVDSQPKGFLVAGRGPSLNLPNPRKAVVDSAIAETTDDWPFLFLPRREIPLVYVWPMLLVMLVSTIPMLRLVTSGRSTVADWQMFCLGMGFMLLETRALSALSLLCGATWTVNSIVIGGVMIMILIANVIAARIPVASDRTQSPVPMLVVAVAISTVVSSMVDVSGLNVLAPWAATVSGVTVYLLPLMFSATIFATLFKQTTLSSRSLAFNIIGGLFGVGIEYLSMAFGIRALSWFALAIYAAVLAIDLGQRKPGSVSQLE